MKKEVKILGLSYSQTQVGSYVVVLSHEKSNKKIPIIIKPIEAQRIAIELEGIKSPRPTIYDLFKTFGDSYMVDVQEVYIHNILESVFYTKIITSNGIENLEFECSVGDAIALSVIYKCPIFTTVEIINEVGIIINDDGTTAVDDDDSHDQDISKKKITTIKNLEKALEDSIKNEDYEIAAKLRDEINKKNDT